MMPSRNRLIASAGAALFFVLLVWGLASISPGVTDYVVYFASEDAMYLVPELRSGVGTIEERIDALLQGPMREDLWPVIPEGAVFLGYEQVDSVCRIDFSRELVTKHSGGSAGETLTLFSVVNTLTEIPGIDKVFFLVEGQIVETLAGHYSLDEAFARDESLILSDE